MANRMPNPEPPTEAVTAIVAKYGMSVAEAEGLLKDLAMQKFEGGLSQGQIAERWEVPFGRVTAIRHMARVDIEDIRHAIVSKCVALANAMHDEMAERLADPEKRQKLSFKDLSTAAAAAHRTAQDYNAGPAQAGATIIAAGDLKIIMQAREQREWKPVREKILEGKTCTSEPSDTTSGESRDSQVVRREPHKLVIAGSNPAPATP